jgi:anthraniloyl-CoA monooxygenase
VIRDRAVTWTDVIVGHQGERVHVGGNDFAGIGRLAFLDALQQRCASLGVDVRYETAVADPRSLQAADLVVGADGVRSTVRGAFEASFGPELDERHNPYVWLGTTQRFPGLAMLFRPSAAGLFIAHAYEYGPEGSTFVVECSLETWRRAGLDRLGEAEALALLEAVFAADLEGAPLRAKDYRWLRFILLRNRTWRHENVTLLGDALHTAHFSIGSGTKLALEDAIALADALAAAPDAAAAIDRYAEARRPDVEAYQAASLESMRWLETLDADLALDPVRFAYRVMTRSGRVSADTLRRRDPEFMARLERRETPRAAAADR